MVTAESTIQFTGKIKDLAGMMPESFMQIHQSYRGGHHVNQTDCCQIQHISLQVPALLHADSVKKALHIS